MWVYFQKDGNSGYLGRSKNVIQISAHWKYNLNNTLAKYLLLSKMSAISKFLYPEVLLVLKEKEHDSKI